MLGSFKSDYKGENRWIYTRGTKRANWIRGHRNHIKTSTPHIVKDRTLKIKVVCERGKERKEKRKKKEEKRRGREEKRRICLSKKLE